MAPSISLEQETKFAVRPAFELPDLRKVVGRSVRQPERSFRTAYFDTPDLRLRDRNITLRYRAGAADRSGTWTVKLPEDDGGATLDRREISWPGTEAKVPAEARALLLGLVRRAPLDQVAEMQTTRLSWMLHGQDDAPWAELDYDDVTVIGGRRDGLRYRQVEIERTGEAMDDQAMAAIKEEVRRAGAEPDDQPKLAKALGPSGTETSEREIGAGRNSTAAGVVRHAIRDALERLLDHDYRLRLRPDSPDSHDVHQARVATRRLRSHLKTVRPLLDPVWLAHTTDELRWLGAVLGAVRDANVMAASLTVPDRRQLPLPAPDSLARLQSRARERARAVAELHDALGSPRYLDLLDRLHAAASIPRSSRAPATEESRFSRPRPCPKWSAGDGGRSIRR